MKRRDFVRYGSMAAGALLVGGRLVPRHLYAQDKKRFAHDRVTLGRTGIQVSRLAQGTGTNGTGGSSNQTRTLGEQGLDMRPRLVGVPGAAERGAGRIHRLGARPGDAVVVGDADDQALLAVEDAHVTSP